jgi:branched-subunit amino acid ABC-type transport system permease component
METLSYSLMAVGFSLVFGGIVAVINFDQPSEVLSSAWWMIVSGWSLALVGIGIEIMRVLKPAKREAS